ncbi:MAG: serine hydrolase [Clostridium sp.]|nr:serine hydrolase [Clostridium sp.]
MRYTNLYKIFLSILLVAAMLTVTSIPAYAKTSSKISLSLNGKRAIIMDMDSGEVLYSKNAKQKCHNASTTKLMTAVVAVEKNKSLNKKVKISGNAAGADGVVVSLARGSRYRMKDLLHGMLIPSANDCAVAVAEGTSGSVSKFMKEVNKKVKKIGCKNTRFGTPNGLRSSKPHYTTAYDLALIMRYAYQNDTIRKILQKKSYSFKSTGGRRHSVKSTNHLLGSKDYYCVGKTGTGWTAKYCFTGVYTYKGHSYVIVTLGSAGDGERFSDARKMISACKKDAKAVRKNLALARSSLEVKVNESVKAKLKGTKAAARWSSKNEAIATVDEDGTITGIQAGTTTIYAKLYRKTLKCKVKVVD